MTPTSITRLTESGINTLIPLAHRIWHAHYPGMITTEQIDYMLERGYTRQVILDEMNHQGVIWLAIRHGDSMIGFASLGPYAPNTMKLHKLYLLPDYHGMGIGARALTEVERIARDNAATKLVLNVNRHNTKAIHAYERAGWKISETVVVDIGNGFVMDDYIMTKQLL
ncbi:MAG: GNAT family N-acetyltransferase [Desulfobacteraceae bacterium]|nr:GNAT family N-acetyltransferase [Desulfobacteraceae bacterium]